MRNIKKALLGVILVLGIIIGLQAIVRGCYEDWDLFTVNSRRERKELEGTLDTVYSGTSLTYHAFLPELLDEELGTNSFNLGTASQPYIGSYYLIQEAADNNPIKQVYLTVSLPPLLKEETKISEYLSAFEFLYTWEWKLRYLTAVGNEEVWTSALFYSSQVKDYYNLSKIKQNLLNKYMEEKIPNIYVGRGYRGSTEIYEGRKKTRNTKINRWSAALGESQLQEEGYEYLEKIVEFCKEEGIKLTLILPPFTQDYINGAEDIEDFQVFLAQKAETWDVTLYDFLRYKELETVFSNDKFSDSHHLNDAGAEAFSRLLAEIEKSESPKEFFYEVGESKK